MKIKYTTFYNDKTNENFHPRYEVYANGFDIVSKCVYTEGDAYQWVSRKELEQILNEMTRLSAQEKIITVNIKNKKQ